MKMESGGEEDMTAIRMHYLDLQMCRIAILWCPSPHLHGGHTTHCSSLSVTELGREPKAWKMLESSNIQLWPKDFPIAIPDFAYNRYVA